MFFVCFRHGCDVRTRAIRHAGLARHLPWNIACVRDGVVRQEPAAIYTAGGVWLLLVVLPGLIAKLCSRRLLQQDYAAARRLARIARRLHPADGFRELPEIIHALELAQQGELTAASETLGPFQHAKSSISVSAIVIMYRITNQWEELLAWHSRHREEMERQPTLVPTLLPALLRTGRRVTCAAWSSFTIGTERRSGNSFRPRPGFCRLMLFVFCGKPQAVASLCAGRLAVLPAAVRAFWLATADLAAGAAEAAQRQLEQLLPGADPSLRGAIERRLSRAPMVPESLDARGGTRP